MKTKKHLQHKLELLTSEMGYDNTNDLLWDNEFTTHSPAICTNEDCDLVHHINPLDDKGICEECGTRTVMSCQRIQEKIAL